MFESGSWVPHGTGTFRLTEKDKQTKTDNNLFVVGGYVSMYRPGRAGRSKWTKKGDGFRDILGLSAVLHWHGRVKVMQPPAWSLVSSPRETSKAAEISYQKCEGGGRLGRTEWGRFMASQTKRMMKAGK